MAMAEPVSHQLVRLSRSAATKAARNNTLKPSRIAIAMKTFGTVKNLAAQPICMRTVPPAPRAPKNCQRRLSATASRPASSSAI